MFREPRVLQPSLAPARLTPVRLPGSSKGENQLGAIYFICMGSVNSKDPG
jgi:hypothetical protein